MNHFVLGLYFGKLENTVFVHYEKNNKYICMILFLGTETLRSLITVLSIL